MAADSKRDDGCGDDGRVGVKDRVLRALVSSFMHLLAALPLSMSQAIGKAIGAAIFHLDVRAAKVTRTNVAACFPDLSDAERHAFAKRSLMQTGQLMMETPAAWLGSQEKIAAWIHSVDNGELFDEALAAGRGVIVLLPHLGNYELANVFFAGKDGQFTGLYAAPSQRWMQQIVEEVRNRFPENELLPASVRSVATLFRRLREGKMVLVLPDQVPQSGEFAPFFGIDALTDGLATRLQRKSGARVVCCSMIRLPDAGGFSVRFSEPHPHIYSDDPVKALTGVNLSVEACVSQAPEQYQWEYKRFKERPAGELRLYNYENEPWTHH